MAGGNKRELDALTLSAADLLPVEMPWRGTPNSPVILFETPHRQLVPFSPFDPSLENANLLIMAVAGGGKTFLAQQLLLSAGATQRPDLHSCSAGIRIDPWFELMGGRVITDVDL